MPLDGRGRRRNDVDDVLMWSLIAASVEVLGFNRLGTHPMLSLFLAALWAITTMTAVKFPATTRCLTSMLVFAAAGDAVCVSANLVDVIPRSFGALGLILIFNI